MIIKKKTIKLSLSPLTCNKKIKRLNNTKKRRAVHPHLNAQISTSTHPI